VKFARVNLEPESFGDPRFAHLARLLGMPGGDGHFALIKVALIWSWQTEHYTPEAPCFHVPEDVVEMALGVEGATGRAALVRARLAEETPDGLRMRGSSHERTGWLWRIRNKSQAGGHAKAESAKRKKANESLPGAEHGHASGVPGETPLSSLLSVPEDLSHPAGAREPVQPVDPSEGWERDVPGKPDAPPPARGADSILSLLVEAAAALNAERVRWSPDAPPIDESTAGGVTARLMATPAADRRRKLMHAVACVIARAKRTRSVDGLRWSTFASESAWAYVVDADVDAYAKSDGPTARDGPRRQSPHAPAPPRKFQTLGPNPHPKPPTP
jgi:hypothetical protein